MRPIQPRMLAHAAMLALLIASPAAALTKELGPIAGFSYSNLNISGQSGLNGRASVALGAALDLGFNEHETVDFKDVLSSTDVSVDLGIGFSLPQGPNRWAIDARAAFGVTNINSGGTVTFNGGPLVVPATSTHTIGFRTLVSYLFKL